jgi:hypothetical protein
MGLFASRRYALQMCTFVSTSQFPLVHVRARDCIPQGQGWKLSTHLFLLLHIIVILSHITVTVSRVFKVQRDA